MLILKKIIFCRNISLVIALWADIFIAYIALKSISTFLRQFYPGGLANFVGYHHLVLHRCSHHLAKQLHCRDGPGCCSSRGILSLTTVPDGIFSPLSPHYLPPLQLFRPYFAVTNLWVSRSLRQLRLPGVQRVIVTVKRITVKVK